MTKKKNNADVLRNEDKRHEFAEKASATEEESFIGDSAGLETDDDMLENAHEMGLYKADDGEHPQELNVAAQVQKAENHRRGMD